MNRRHFVIGGAAVLVLAAGGFEAFRRERAVSVAPAPSPADAAAGLFEKVLPDPEGVLHEFALWKGKPLLVNFWATWCAPCVREMPHLDALRRAYPAVQFTGIGIDSADNIRAFLRKVQVAYPLLIMSSGGTDLIRELGNGPGGLPFTIIFNADGSINRKILGEIDPADVARTLSALVAAA